MRDARFIAAHRCGLLSKSQHHELMTWAIACSEHVLHLLWTDVDKRLLDALDIAKKRVKNEVPVGAAMKASVHAHTVAREYINPVFIVVARSIWQCVATAHMADHSLGAAIYALKAIQHTGTSIDEEKKWQNKQIPPEMKDLVIKTRMQKEQGFRDLRI